MDVRECIVCGGKVATVVFSELDVDVLRCSNCGHYFSSHVVDQSYDGYFGYEQDELEDVFWWSTAHDKMYESFCRRFIDGKSGRLLDIGCGLGFFLKKMSEYPSWEVYGYEVSPVASDSARKRLGLENVIHGNVLDSGFKPESYDIVTMWDVIEHIPDPDPVLSYVHKLLKEEGFLFIHTPNTNIQLPKARLKKTLRGSKDTVHYLEARDHINLYTTSTMIEILKRNGLGVVSFVHLDPIQSVCGGKNSLLILLKNLWYYFAVILYRITFGRVNLDNLFVVARKRY